MYMCTSSCTCRTCACTNVYSGVRSCVKPGVMKIWCVRSVRENLLYVGTQQDETAPPRVQRSQMSVVSGVLPPLSPAVRQHPAWSAAHSVAELCATSPSPGTPCDNRHSVHTCICTCNHKRSLVPVLKAGRLSVLLILCRLVCALWMYRVCWVWVSFLSSLPLRPPQLCSVLYTCTPQAGGVPDKLCAFSADGFETVLMSGDGWFVWPHSSFYFMYTHVYACTCFKVILRLSFYILSHCG